MCRGDGEPQAKSGQRTRHRLKFRFFGRCLAACHESTQQWQKERLAEADERRHRFLVEGLADDVSVVLVEDKPEAHVGIEARPALLDGWDLHGEPGRFRLLGCNGEEQDQIAVLAGEPNADCDGSVFASLRLTRLGLARPEIGIAKDDTGLELLEAYDREGSSSRA